MTAKKDSKTFPPADKISLYEKLIKSNSLIERKGDTIPYTSLNGHMFSFLDKEGFMSIRLPKDELQNFLVKYQTKHPVQYGCELKEYGVLPDSLLQNIREAKKYLNLSYEYIKTLKPKPTTKSPKKAAKTGK